jgi:Na+/H+ antiporter NhaC
MKILRNIVLVIFTCFAFAKADLHATTTAATTQCAMCRAVLESEEDNSTAKGINNGIKYLMVIPYILVGGVFYFVYKSRKNTTDDTVTKE